jgi:hypothetical protein
MNGTTCWQREVLSESSLNCVLKQNVLWYCDMFYAHFKIGWLPCTKKCPKLTVSTGQFGPEIKIEMPSCRKCVFFHEH